MSELNDNNNANNNDNNNNDNNNANNNKKSFMKNVVVVEIISWIKTIAFAVIFAYLITTFLIVNARVPSSSMENTVMPGDRLIANRLSYVISKPERFDVIVFKYPDDEETLFIKRIIGLPGETVEIKDNQVYIDGSDTPIKDSFIKEEMDTEDAVFKVPQDSYFMLGDNRNNSKDSRLWNNKFVEKEKILGKAIIKYYPKIEILTNK